jgi:signal transduction histidine kinase
MKQTPRQAAARGVGLQRLRWYRTLGFRLAALFAVTLVAFDLLRRLLRDLTLRWLGEGGVDRGPDPWAAMLLSGTLGVLLAILVAVPISRWLTGRLTDLARAAAEPKGEDDLPGPFNESGHDEISIAARSMNILRGRVEKRLKDFALQDIRRREFIARVSHDLRTPLAAQLACLDRAGTMLDRPDSELLRKELRELIEVAKMDADRVQILADDLLEIARLDAGDRLHLEPVPPGELVRQAVRGLEPLASQKGIKVEVSLTTHLPVLHADGRRLTRAIENLLRNAIEHAKSTVEVVAVLTETSVRFEVRDDGQGLPRERGFLEYLSKLGSDIRLTELAKRRGRSDSAGLGLVVAQRVAEAHDGKIDAYDRTQGGAAFCMEIPLPADADLAAEHSPPPATRRSRKDRA